MTPEVRILRSLDPYHQRIGYLGALSAIANRGLDTADAVRKRLSDLLYTKIYPDDLLFGILMSRLHPERVTALNKLLEQRSSSDVASVFRRTDEPSWFYLSEFWLCDDQMPSPLGFVSPQKISRVVDLSKWCGILRSTHELSESGYVLYLLLEDERQKSSLPAAYNLLNARCREGAMLTYFRMLLEVESLWPFLVIELVEQDATAHASGNILGMAVERMLRTLGEPSSPADILPIKPILDFRRTLSGSKSTADNYLRPRLEILVDLGLLTRSTGREHPNRSFAYRINDVTVALADEMKFLATSAVPLRDFLETRFFSTMARVYGKRMRSAESLEDRLIWFARSFSQVGRDLGLTPGSTVAHLACLHAWEHGVTIELSDMMETIYEAKKGQWADYLQMSGGSRFDREFFIRVRPGLVEQLQMHSRESA